MSQANLKKLQKEWYKKLKEDTTHPDGAFKDIERNEFELQRYASSVLDLIKNHEGEAWLAKRDYYQFAEFFLNEYRFDSELDKTIWEYHTNGVSYRDIAKVLKKARQRIKSRTAVYVVITKLRKSMFSMYLLPKVTAYHE